MPPLQFEVKTEALHPRKDTWTTSYWRTLQPQPWPMNIQRTSWFLQTFSWISFPKIALQLSHCLEYLSLIVNIAQDSIFLPLKKVASLRTHRETLILFLHEGSELDCNLFWNSFLHLVSLQTSLIQHTMWNKQIQSMYCPMLLSSQSSPWHGGSSTPALELGMSLLYMPWRVMTPVASLKGWCKAYNYLTLLETWLQQIKPFQLQPETVSQIVSIMLDLCKVTQSGYNWIISWWTF